MENTSSPNIPERWAPRFFTFWTGQSVSLIGSSLVQFALVWWMTKTTGSATVLATASLIAMLPRILLSPVAGALVDRWNRKAVLIVADGLIALATLVLMVLFATGLESLWAVYVILLVRACGTAFHGLAESASVALMVPKAQLTRIAGVNQTLSGALNIVSPPLGALLISLLPMQGVLAIDVGTAAIAITILAFIAIPQPLRQLAQANGTAEKTTLWQDFREGWTYLVAWPGLLGVVLIAMAINFFLVPIFSLMPLVVTQEYHGSAYHLGLADSLLGIGSILGGVLLGAWGGFKKRILTAMLGVAGVGVGVLVFGLLPSDWFPVALGGILLAGIMLVLSNAPLDALLQATVDPDKQARVFSLTSASAAAMAPLSLLIAGPVTDWLGVRTWYALGGGACFLIPLIATFIPAIIHIEENRREKPAEPAELETASQAGLSE